MKHLMYVGAILSLMACANSNDEQSSLDLQQLSGQWVVINYWAQWCKPCIEEIPHLNTLNKDYPQVTVLGVNYDGASGEALEQQRQALGVTFTSLTVDPAKQLGKPRPAVLPTTFIVNPEGELKATLLGPQTLESLVQATRQNSNAEQKKPAQ